MKQIINDITAQLRDLYPEEEARSMAWWIAEESTGLSRAEILTGCKGTKNIPNLQEIMTRLRNFEPIQYIFGHTLWYGLDLKVSKATLIPRPETAELVEQISIFNSQFSIFKSPIRVLDIGTGSGCIAIGIKKNHPQWQVTGIDISEEAIAIAKENAARNGVEVEFRVMDIFSDEIEHFCNSEEGGSAFDIVVSNPPYICESEKKGMRKNVLDYEPESALFVPDNDALRFYRRICELRLGELLCFEINEAYGAEMREMMEKEGYQDIILRKDMYGKDRMIAGRMEKSIYTTYI